MADMTEEEAKARLRLLELEGMSPSISNAPNAEGQINGPNQEKSALEAQSPLVRGANERTKELSSLIQGVAEGANPLNIPYGVEWLGRKLIPGVSSNPEDFYTKPIPINEATAQVEAAIHTPFSDQSHSELLKKYRDMGDQYDQANISPGAKKLGELGVGAYGLAQGVKALGNLAGFGDFAKSAANENRVAALGGGKRAIKDLLAKDKIQALGEQLGKDQVMGPMTSREVIQANIENAQNAYGQKIGSIVNQAGKVNEGSGIVPADTIISKAIDEVWTPLAQRSTTRKAAAAIADEIDNFKAAHGGKMLSLEDLQQFKKDLSDTQNIFSRAGDNPTVGGYRGLYNAFNKGGEEALKGVESQLPAGNSLADFQAAKEGYGLNSTALKMIADRNARTAANRMLSPTDYGAGAIGALTSAAHGNNPVLSLATGGASAAANKLLRSYGNQTKASIWQMLADQFQQNPKLIDQIGPMSGLANLAPKPKP